MAQAARAVQRDIHGCRLISRCRHGHPVKLVQDIKVVWFFYSEKNVLPF
jgi:hypothetical protein